MSINEHPPEVRRRHTQMSGNLSLFSRLTGRSDRRHGTTERTGPQYEYYPCYDLSWATLKKFLEEKWPNKKFPDDGEKVIAISVFILWDRLIAQIDARPVGF